MTARKDISHGVQNPTQPRLLFGQTPQAQKGSSDKEKRSQKKRRLSSALVIVLLKVS
jgi:hypothetical protein